MSYRVEIAKQGRAGCKNKECKDAAVKIDKGELRFGTFVTIRDHQSWSWKHWGCVTPVQIANWQEATTDGDGGYDTDLIDGFDEIPQDAQNKVILALNDGHVADEDWRGDVSQNRPGQKGFRSPAAKKARRAELKAKAEAEAEAEEADDSAPPDSPVKKKGGKRGRAKEDDDAEEPEAPATKKPRGRGKKAAAPAAKDDDDEDEPQAAPAKKGRGRPKKAAKQDDDDEEEVDEDVKPRPAPAKKSKGKGRAKEAAPTPSEERQAEPEEESPEPAKKKGRGRPRKAAQADDTHMADADDAVDDKPKRRGRPKKD